MAEKKFKQPSEVLDFDIIADKRLTDDDSIVSAGATFSGPDSNLVIMRVTWSGTVAKVWLSGGTDGCTYKVTVEILTANGRQIESEFYVQVKDI
jgi:hypothetical protein